jgi:hypothetical protein
VINLGTNDNNTHNNVTNERYLHSYIEFIAGVHKTYPHAQIVVVTLWNEFQTAGNSYAPGEAFMDEIEAVYNHYKHTGFVHYFNTRGILQHNDIVSIAITIPPCYKNVRADTLHRRRNFTRRT